MVGTALISQLKSPSIWAASPTSSPRRPKIALNIHRGALHIAPKSWFHALILLPKQFRKSCQDWEHPSGMHPPTTTEEQYRQLFGVTLQSQEKISISSTSAVELVDPIHFAGCLSQAPPSSRGCTGKACCGSPGRGLEDEAAPLGAPRTCLFWTFALGNPANRGKAG